MLRAVAAIALSLAAATASVPAAQAAPPRESAPAAATLAGRWNMAFDMPQGSYETPVEFIVAGDGTVTASILGPLGSFSIRNITGSLEGDRLTLKADTSYGKLKVGARLAGDRLEGKWFPSGFIAPLFFKGGLHGLRDPGHVPAPPLEIFDSVLKSIEAAFYAPDYAGVDLASLRARYRPLAAAARGEGELLGIVRRMLGEFHSSHLDFFATPAWTPQLHPAAPAGPAPDPNHGISWRRLAPSIGYLRIESFDDDPAVVERVDRAFVELGNAASLVVDLRGNGGGALGAAMRLGDHILPNPRPVGYFASRGGLIRRNLRSIDQLDASALTAFTGYDGGELAREMERAGALMLTTGGRAAPYRGRIVLLIDEYCFSASEALAGVVKETRAAMLIGRKTPGLMLAATNVTIEGGWTLLLPIWDFRTPAGVKVEGVGVAPDIQVKARQGKDADLAAALKFLKTRA